MNAHPPKCSQVSCPEKPAFRFTWPGRDESVICVKHAVVAVALGLHPQLLPFESSDEAPSVEMPSSLEPWAEQIFNAYNAQGPNPWKTFDGRDVPRWPDLTDQVRAKWEAAAAEAVRLIRPSESST